MEILTNILVIGGIFAVFVFLLIMPFAFITVCIGTWYSKHPLPAKAWRRRRIWRAFMLVRSALFLKLSTWKKVTLKVAFVGVLFLVFLSVLRSAVYCDSIEGIEVYGLRTARSVWMLDGCPQSPDLENELACLRGDTNYVCKEIIKLGDSSYHGLFASKDFHADHTYVIATTGEVFVIDASGKTRLLYKPTTW